MSDHGESAAEQEPLPRSRMRVAAKDIRQEDHVSFALRPGVHTESILRAGLVEVKTDRVKVTWQLLDSHLSKENLFPSEYDSDELVEIYRQEEL